MTNRVHSEVPAIKIKNMKMNEQQQLQHHHQQRQLVADLMEQQNRRRRRASISSESSVEAMDLARMPNRSAKHNGSSPSSSRSEHIDSDNFESDAEDFSTKYKRQLSQHTNFARGVGEQERRNSRNSSSNSSNGGNIRKKFRSSTPNRGNNNNSTGVSTTTHNSSIASSLPSDRTQNESGFVDVSSSQHLNSSPEPPSATDRDDVKYICPICEVVSATPHEFTNHIRCHNYSSGDTENFTCRICSKVLSSASSLDRHVLVHTGERPFNCKYCHLTFTTNGNMHRHMRTHKQHMQQRNANIAGGGGGVGNGNSNHNNGNNRNVAPPGSGGSGGGTSSGNGDGESDESDGCSTDSSASSSNNNIKYNNNNNNDNHNNYNKRKITDEETTAGTLKRRVKTTINNNIISESELEYTSGGQQKYSCPLCSRSDFADMFTLGSHMDREHPGIPAKCRQCEMVFKSHKSLNAHRCSQQQKINVTQGFKDMTFVDFSSEKFPLIAKSLCEQSIHTPITSQKFECPKCLRAFPCASAVDIHAKDCGDSPAHDYSIRKRGASESSEEEIRRDEFFAHLDLRNKSAMSLASTMSSPRTSEKSDSNVKIDHERNTATSHSGTYNCNESKDLADIQSILNVTSSSNSFLRNFENVVNTPPASDYILGKDEEEAQDAFTSEFRKMKLRGEFPCKLCTAVYPNLRALKGHNRVHLSAAGAGPYRCNMCPYSIHDKAALIRHMRTHNGDRPYECAVCNYAFTTKANCERHLRNRHAKTTREEVKRAIIYHPSEDSSCEDPIKKLQMFSSPEFDEDDHPSAPKDRSTPVSHLKEMLQSTSPIKIQVKSLEKLMDTSNMSVRSTEEKGRSEQDTSTTSIDSTRPIDLSMDVLDLSKKAKIDEPKPVEKPEPKAEDLSTLEKNHQWLLAQQQIFKDSLSQMDPAHYLQLSQLYRNLMFPSIPPFLFPNTFLPNNFGDLNKFPPMLLNPLFPRSAESVSQESAGMRPTSVAQPSSVAAHSPLKGPENPPSSLQLPPSMPQQLTIPRHPLAGAQPPPSMLSQMQNTGPVKMVIKNGVLMPKQKQRRYRTERPFTCEHCAARFTLRSNMERHVKQQHPQFWAQRQRSGHHIMRRGGSVMSQMSATSISPQGAGLPSNHFSAISDQVKYAILAHQLKAPKDSDILQQALTQNKVNLDSNHLSMVNNNIQSNMMGSNGFEDDDPKLIIDEGNEGNDEAEEEEDEDDDIYEESKPEDLSSNVTHSVAKQVAENILEQAKKASSQMVSKNPAGDDDCEPNDHHNMDASNSMLTQAESVGKYLKKVANSSFKEDSSDLVPVSKLVDNATNSMSSFNTYFRPTDMANHMEQSDEEGLVASGSTSESTNSGNEAEPQGSNGPEGKRKSAYSLAPNRVSCNYCQRTFPWTSSLRRHILTHTGQKPFKCSHCPLLFTTKSNCDRHLLRKHGNVESAVSLYVPIADIPDPVPMPRAEEPAEEQLKTHLATANCLNLTVPNLKTMEPLMSSSDLPFKCHLCDSSFAERNQCLDHIKISHSQEFALLLAKGAIDAEAEHNQIHSTEDDERCGEGRGKYPDYANRKVMCAFCMRRFWSTEDLRRHMRTHSGERPFQCEVCLRKFTLKHSMLRHMKKHSNGHNNHQLNHLNSGSDMSEDEQTPPPPPASLFHKNPLLTQKIREALRAEAWRQSNLSGDQKEKIAQSTHSLRLRMEKDAGVSGAVGNEENSDLISDLLGITGQGILNKLLSSPDEAAKLLGVDK